MKYILNIVDKEVWEKETEKRMDSYLDKNIKLWEKQRKLKREKRIRTLKDEQVDYMIKIFVALKKSFNDCLNSVASLSP